MAHCPSAFERYVDVKAVPDMFQYPYGEARWRQVLWLFRTLVWMTVVGLQALAPVGRPVVFRSKVQHFYWADSVVSVGAERLNDKYVKNVVFALFSYWLAVALKRRMILFPCTIGPLYRKATRWLCRLVLTRVDVVYVRDKESRDIVIGLGAGAGENMICTADVAVLQESAADVEVGKVVPVWPFGTVVGLSVMRWTYVSNEVKTDLACYSSYVREMAQFADEVITRYNATIVLIPTNFPVHGCREDDLTTSREVLSQMERKGRAVLVDRLPSPGQLKAVLSRCDVNIVTRMHACILSTAAGVPTMSVNYLFKLRSYMESLGMEEYAIDIERFSCVSALGIFDRLWASRAFLRAHLRDRIAERQLHVVESVGACSAFV
jgi:polysaccharide pyruvyl transferase WcaK-like protein